MVGTELVAATRCHPGPTPMTTKLTLYTAIVVAGQLVQAMFDWGW